MWCAERGRHVAEAPVTERRNRAWSSVARTQCLLILIAALLPIGCATTRAVSAVGETAYEVSLADSGNRMALVWQGGGLAHSALWLRFMDANGRPQGSVLQLTDGRREAYEPDLQAGGAQFALAWYEKEPSTGTLTAWLACLDASARELWRRQLSAVGHNGRNPVVRLAGRQWQVAWIESSAGDAPAIWTARYSAAGEPSGNALLAAPASDNTWNLNAAVDASGALYVVYDAALGARAPELQLVRIAGNRITRHALSIDDGFDSVYPDIAIDADRVAVAWFDSRDGNQEVYLHVGALADLTAMADAPARRITRTPGASYGAYLAWNAGRLGLAWNDDIAGAAQVFTQRFDAAGRALGGRRQLTHGAARSLTPSIRPWRRGFAIAWNEYTPDVRDPQHVPPSASVAELQLLR